MTGLKFSAAPPTASVLDFLARISARNQSLMILQQTRGHQRKALTGAGKVHRWRSGRATCHERYVMGRVWLPRAGGRRRPESTLSLLRGQALPKLSGDYANRLGTPDLLVKLACGRVVADPFEPRLVRQLKEEVLSTLERHSHSVLSKPGDRDDLPIDFRFLQQLLQAAEDPRSWTGRLLTRGSGGSRGTTPQTAGALCKEERRWQLPEQQPGQLEDLPTGEESPWQRNYSSVAPLEKQVVDSEREAREKYPGLVVAALGAVRKDKPDGEYTARVLFDGTNGIPRQ